MPSPSLRLRRLTHPDALFALEAQLDALAAQQPRPTPFCTVPYLHALACAAAEAFDYRTVWRGDELVGLLPLVCAPRVRFGIPVPRLGFAPGRPALPGDWLLDPSLHGALPELLTALRESDVWADAYFTKLAADSVLVAAAQQAGLPCVEVGGEYSTTLTPRWEDVCARFSSNRRRQIRRLLRLEKFGPGVGADIAVLPEPAGDAATLVQDMRAILDRSWKSAAPAFAAQCELFLRMTPGMMERERVVCFLLRLDERPAAFLLLYRAGGHLYAVLNGHDPQAAAGSPGATLIAAALRWGCAHGFRALHFGNDTPYLRHWSSVRAPVYAVRLYNATLRGRLLRAFSGRPAGSDLSRQPAHSASLACLPGRPAPSGPDRRMPLTAWVRRAFLVVYEQGYRRFDSLLVPLENRLLGWYARRAPAAFARRIQTAIDRGLRYVDAQPHLEISTLVALLRFAGVAREPRLRSLEPKLEAYRRAWRDPHLRLFDRDYDPERDGAGRPHEFETASPMELCMIACLYADRRGLGDAALQELRALDDGGGYGTTHVLFGCALLREVGACSEDARAALEASTVEPLLRAARTARLDDLYCERLAFLQWCGYHDRIEPAWMLRVALGQLRDGGWYWRRVAVRPRSGQHPTCLALSALIHFREHCLRRSENG